MSADLPPGCEILVHAVNSRGSEVLTPAFSRANVFSPIHKACSQVKVSRGRSRGPTNKRIRFRIIEVVEGITAHVSKAKNGGYIAERLAGQGIAVSSCRKAPFSRTRAGLQPNCKGLWPSSVLNKAQ